MLGDWFGFDDRPKRRRKTIPKAVKYTVWDKYIGADKAEGKCSVRSRTIHMSDFDVGHNRARSKGGRDTIENLRPLCRTCNSSMGTTSIEVFKRRHFSTGGSNANSRATKSSPKIPAKKTPARNRRQKPPLENLFF